jgi:nitroreductase
MIFKKAKTSAKPFVKKIRAAAELARLVTYDAMRFMRYSGVFRKGGHQPSTAALITKQYHRIEKGLALAAPRPGFGEPGIKELCELVSRSIRQGTSTNETTLAIDALAGYRDFNIGHGIQPKVWLVETLALAASAGIHPNGLPTKRGTASWAASDGIAMITSRASVRHYSDAPVPDSVIESAISVAQHAPCVCNRQSGRIHVIRDPAIKAIALSHQNGNRGFGESAPAVAIVTVDQSEMLEPTERYQHWIDGGMFAQNFLLGLHVQGYGACPLNWSASTAKDRAIRKALGFIDDAETIIMMVSIGVPAEGHSVARSERRPSSEVVTIA